MSVERRMRENAFQLAHNDFRRHGLFWFFLIIYQTINIVWTVVYRQRKLKTINTICLTMKANKYIMRSMAL